PRTPVVGHDSAVTLDRAGSHAGSGLVGHTTHLGNVFRRLSYGGQLECRRFATSWRLRRLRDHAAVMPAVIRPGSAEPLRVHGGRCDEPTGPITDVTGPAVQRAGRILRETHCDVGIGAHASPSGAVPRDAVELLVVDRITEED